MTENNKTLDKDIDPDREMKYGKRQIEISAKDLNDIVRKLEIRNKELKEEILKLQDESFIINKVPERVYEAVKKLSPEITRNMLLILRQEMLQEFDKNIKFCNIKLKELDGNIQQAMARASEGLNKAASHDINVFKKKSLIFMGMLLLTTFSTLGAIHLIVQNFPSYVRNYVDSSDPIKAEALRTWKEMKKKAVIAIEAEEKLKAQKKINH